MQQLMTGIHMGGYACYVWSAYGVAAVVLIANHVNLRWQRAKIHHILKQWYNRAGS